MWLAPEPGSLYPFSHPLLAPPPPPGALTSSGPQGRGAAPLSAPLCLAEDAAGQYISPFHDIPLYADAGKVRGLLGLGGRRRLRGRQRGCRAEGTLQKVFEAGPTLLLAAQRERGGLPSRTAMCWSSAADTVPKRSSKQNTRVVLCSACASGAEQGGCRGAVLPMGWKAARGRFSLSRFVSSTGLPHCV